MTIPDSTCIGSLRKIAQRLDENNDEEGNIGILCNRIDAIDHIKLAIKCIELITGPIPESEPTIAIGEPEGTEELN